MKIGILGLQGCTEPHRRKLHALGVEAQRVVYPEQLRDCTGLILPGGESTTMLKTATPGLWEAIAAFAAERSVWGICAGCIVLAKDVSHPRQASLGIVDIDVVRNAYGAQNESFIANLEADLGGSRERLDCVFIRAPVISRVGSTLKVCARHGQEPVLLESERHLVATFHPELTDSPRVHAYFLAKCRR